MRSLFITVIMVKSDVILPVPPERVPVWIINTCASYKIFNIELTKKVRNTRLFTLG